MDVTDETESTHFSLNSTAFVTSVLENRNTSNIDISQFGIVELKDRNGVEYIAPFDIETLKPSHSGQIYGLVLKPRTPIKVRVDLTKLLWGKPKADVLISQSMKAVVMPGEYSLCFLVVCSSCKPIIQTSKFRKVTFF